MGKTAQHFLLAFFDLAFALILLINFFGWISAIEGVVRDGFEGFGNWGLIHVEDESRLYYFGFQSFFDMLDYLNNFMDNDSFAIFKFSNLTNYLYELLNSSVGGLPKFIQYCVNLANGNIHFDILGFLASIVQMLAFPVMFVGYGALIGLCFTWYALGLLSAFVCALGGMFNTYTINPMTPSDYLSSLSAMTSI